MCSRCNSQYHYVRNACQCAGPDNAHRHYKCFDCSNEWQGPTAVDRYKIIRGLRKMLKEKY